MTINSINRIFLTVLLVTLVITSVCSGQTPIESLLPKDLPEGWVLVSGPQIYTKKTLFEHIDGQAELFSKYGFQNSVFAIYQDKKNRKSQIELDIYDMGSVLQAFGIFSRFRSEDQPAGVGLDSYIDDQSMLFYKGKYFVMFYATESNSSMLKEWATITSLGISDPSPPPREIGYFPRDVLEPGSIQYFPEGLLGYQFLGRGFQGTYLAKVEVKDERKAKPENKEFHLFLAILKNPQDAESALRTYRDHLSKKGKVHSDIATKFRSPALRGEDPYHGNVLVVPKGFYLAGILGFENAKNAEKLLEVFFKNIQ